MPESAKMAAVALAGLGFLMTLMLVSVVYSGDRVEIDGFRKMLLVGMICLRVALFASAVMVWFRIPQALPTAVLVAICWIPFFPIGTGFSVFALLKLFKEDTRRYLGQ